MVEEVFAPGIVGFFDDTRPVGRLLPASFAQNDGMPAIAVEGGIGAAKKGNRLQPVTRHIIRVIARGEAFVRDGKVHEAGIARHKEVGLIEKRGNFQQARSGFARAQEDTTGEKRNTAGYMMENSQRKPPVWQT